jgi:hypothetical protein
VLSGLKNKVSVCNSICSFSEFCFDLILKWEK